MRTITQQKRLNKIEATLTPKECAIHLVHEIRKHPSIDDCLKAWAKLPYDELPTERPYSTLEAQAQNRHPGQNPDAIRGRHSLTVALCEEFHMLRVLLAVVNERIQLKVEALGMEAALRLSALRVLMLQDAFAEAATQAAEWIEAHEPTDPIKESQRQTLLTELAVFTGAGIRQQSLAESLTRGGIALYPSLIEQWSHEMVDLVRDLFAHQAAVRLIQTQHFDGRPILYPAPEAQLAEVARTIENAIAIFNEYLMRRAEHLGIEPNPDRRSRHLAISIESIKTEASNKCAAAIAGSILHEGKVKAEKTDAYGWEQLRETILAPSFAVNCAD